jgi:uncharacterized nucleotidyltransferase DUF6036
MRRDELEHVIGAAANVTGEDEFVVIGSQAILASHPNAPPELLISMEADVYPRQHPEKADHIDGALGDGSQFHVTFGYYAHGVGPETAKAPAGWQERLVPIDIPPRAGSSRPAVAWCLEIHDLVLAKLVAGRARDWEFARDALAAGLVRVRTLRERVEQLPVRGAHREHIASLLAAMAAQP